jgi:Secretion system C-terminal sorting domain
MKKLVKMLLLQGFFLLTMSSAIAQQITDVTLKNAILASCPPCLDNNGNLLIAAKNIQGLGLTFNSVSTIQTSKGLEGFTNVTKIQILDTTGRIHKFDSFPPNVVDLTIWGNIEIRKLPDSLLVVLYLQPNNISYLPILPKKLLNFTVLTNGINSKVKGLPVLPPSLKFLIISNFTALQYIPKLPDSLINLDLTNDNLIENLPLPLPSRLVNLYLGGTKIKCLPILPNSLAQLSASNVNCLPDIPPSLNQLSLIIGGNNVTTISNTLICGKNNEGNCQYPAFISGKVYFDLNNNGVQNSNEPSAKQVFLKSTDGSLVGITDTTGKYFLTGDSLKTYTLNPIFSHNYFNLITPRNRTISTTAATAQSFDNLDFAIQSNGTFPDIAVSITSGEARPGFNSISTLTYKNIGTTVLNGTITLTLDAKQIFISADIPPTSQNGNVLTWNYANLLLFDFKNINITLKTLVTAPLSSVAISTVSGTIAGATDANPLNNSETTQITVRGSYDPNDKQVDKISVPTVTAIATTPLTYTIRFQNTGNAEAIRVEVVDTLTKKLDITTIEMLGASHPYEMKIVSDSGKIKDFTVVKWTFDDINLPDSTSNEKGSHGFIKYRIKNDTKKMGLTVDSILNKAAIYFDFNSPIITNQARTLFNPRVATVELKDLGLNVFPNPVSNVLTINSTQKIEQELTIDVVNTNGQVLIHKILRGQNPQINVQELSAGLYFLKIKTSEGIGIVKIFKE